MTAIQSGDSITVRIVNKKGITLADVTFSEQHKSGDFEVDGFLGSQYSGPEQVPVTFRIGNVSDAPEPF